MSRPRTALLAWEIGGGIGHAVPMLPIARRLARHGIRSVAAVRSLLAARQLAAAGIEVLQAPLWPALPGGRRLQRGTALTLADVLANVGLSDPVKVSLVLGAWQGLIDRLRPDLVVADYAPAATLVGRGRVPTVQCSTSFCLPPQELEVLPALLAGSPPPIRQGDMLATLNRCLEHRRLQPLSRLPQLFAGDRHVVRSFPVLDIYGRLRPEPASGPFVEHIPEEHRPSGRTTFAYLNRNAARAPQLASALKRLGRDLHVFAPELAGSGLLRELAEAGAVIQREMRPLSERLATARLFIHHGNAGAASEALAIGVPQLALPHDLEKLLNGRLLQRTGAGRVAHLARVTSADIEAMLADERMGVRAAELGEEHRRILRDDPLGLLERACLECLGGPRI